MWIYFPSACSPSAPDLVPSISELNSHAQALAASVWSRGEPTKPSFWLRAWKLGSYLRLRSGATQEPSILARGVAQWIASCRAIPASRTASPARNSARTTTDGSSTTSSASSTACGLIVSSERTSQGTLTTRSAISSRHWKAWVTALRAECSEREPQEPDKSGSASSLWPTVAARDHRSPNSQDSQDRRNEGSSRGQQLMNFIAYELPEMWSTLTAAAAHGSQLTRGNERSDELLLGGQAILLSSRLDQETSTPGEPFSVTRLALNPLFAEWLMGWPIGWTELKPLETELSQWRQRARGLVLKLCSQPTPRLDLFG